MQSKNITIVFDSLDLTWLQDSSLRLFIRMIRVTASTWNHWSWRIYKWEVGRLICIRATWCTRLFFRFDKRIRFFVVITFCIFCFYYKLAGFQLRNSWISTCIKRNHFINHAICILFSVDFFRCCFCIRFNRLSNFYTVDIKLNISIWRFAGRFSLCCPLFCLGFKGHLRYNGFMGSQVFSIFDIISRVCNF